MKLLVIGGGGREHALVWKLKQSARVKTIWCAPGNGGIAAEADCVAADPGDVSALVALAEKTRPDITVVGPELPLVNGLVDAFTKRNWPIVGPSQQAAQLRRHRRLGHRIVALVPHHLIDLIDVLVEIQRRSRQQLHRLEEQHPRKSPQGVAQQLGYSQQIR